MPPSRDFLSPPERESLLVGPSTYKEQTDGDTPNPEKLPPSSSTTSRSRRKDEVHATTPDPWTWLAGVPGVYVRTERLEGDRMGAYLADELLITLDDRLTSAEERSTLAHEIVHAERGDHGLCGQCPDGDRLEQLQEQLVNHLAARRLILLENLADVLARTSNIAEAAEELHVDEDTLWHRLNGLADGESLYLQQRIERLEEASWPTT
jgi:Zn-dependent peptidase ImmA (M78 family)